MKKHTIYLSSLSVAFFLFFFTFHASAQVTITLGSGTTTLGTSPSGPSPYNNEYAGRVMQFVYTASEIKAAGGSVGEIKSIAFKVESLCKEDIPDYGIWMKNTSASDASSHDASNLKQVMNRFKYTPGSTGWQTLTLDSAFYWNGSSNLLVHICFGPIGNPNASGDVYAYNTSANQRRGEYSKGNACGTSTSSAFTLKPFIQFELEPYCIYPSSVSFSGITSKEATANWTKAASGAQGYEYVLSTTSKTPSSPGTYTKDTAATFKSLCPGELYYFFVRSVCDKGDTSEWTKSYAFSTSYSGKLSHNAPVCVGDSLIMSVETAVSYSWSGPSGFSSTIRNPNIPSAKKANSGNYVVTITDTDNCVATYSASLRVDTLPIIVITHNSPVCAGKDVVVSASGGSKYSWTGPNSFVGKTFGFAIGNAATNITGSYVVEAENSFGCMSKSQVAIVVNETPSFSITSNAPRCQGDTVKFSASGNYTFAWSGPNSFAASTQNPVIVNASTANTGTYTVIASTKEKCTSQETHIAVVHQLPTVDIAGKADICEKGNLSFTASGALKYEWLKSGIKLDTGETYQITNIDQTNAGTYRLMGIDKNNCSAWTEKVVSILTLPIISISMPDSICAGKTLTLIGQSDGATNGWEGPAGFKTGTLTATVTDVGAAQQGAYTFKSTAANGCVAELKKSVTVLAMPVVSISKEGNNLLASAGYSTYKWFKDGKEVSSTSGRLFTVSEIGSYTVEVTGGNGCSGSSPAVNVSSLGIADVSRTDFVMYPNPVSHQLYLSANHSLGEIYITNYLGEHVYEANCKSNEMKVAVEHLVPGMYFISIREENGAMYRKAFVKQ